MTEINKEELVKEAAIRSHARKSMHIAKVELLPHIAKAIEQLENLRALAEIIATKNNTDKAQLIKWLRNECFPEVE